MEQKLKEFFEKIQRLKNNKQNLTDLDELMNDEFIRDLETDRKQNSRRLNSFIETIINNRDYSKILRPRFNFQSPIKFSTKDLSDKSDKSEWLKIKDEN